MPSVIPLKKTDFPFPTALNYLARSGALCPTSLSPCWDFVRLELVWVSCMLVFSGHLCVSQFFVMETVFLWSCTTSGSAVFPPLLHSALSRAEVK